ncbi:diguanylate cyclase domain-containing protein [Euzebya rosea]|uniref:diguanylate cyclase domain-containing protein n=1 Tax=Euzebya rosea TaxID=2052804 RepID=UPI000D3E0F65|nr:diguanylate cyclase [Euzebya rosea]
MGGIVAGSLLVTAMLMALTGPTAAPLVPLPVPWVALVLGFCVADGTRLTLRLHRECRAFSLSEVPLLVGVLASTPVAVATASGIAMLAWQLWGRKPLRKASVNVTMALLEAGMAVAITRVLVEPGPSLHAGHWTAALVGIVGAMATSGLVVSWVLAAVDGPGTWATSLQALAVSLVFSVGLAGLTVAELVLLSHQPTAGLLLLGPAAVVVLAHRAHVAAMAESGRVAFVARFTTTIAAAQGHDAALRQLLDHVGQELGAGFVDVLQMHPRDGTMLRVRRDTGGLQVRDTLGKDDTAAVAEYLAVCGDGEIVHSPDGHTLSGYLASADITDALLVPLGDHETLSGLFVVANRDPEAPSWGRGDLEIAVTVTRHTGAILRSAELASSLSDMTAEHGRLLHESHHDPLTGLTNRRGLLRALADVDDGSPVALLTIDLDDFKAVNDTHGHAVGDDVLRAVGLRLRAVSRSGDVVARLGGDEFVVLLDPPPDPLAEVVDRVASTLAEPVIVGDRVIRCTGSVGAAVGSVDGLMKRADDAMYRAKRSRATAARTSDRSSADA